MSATKKLKKAAFSALALLMLLNFSGCSLNFFSIESLLSPPTLSGKNGEVQAAFEKYITSKTVQLKTPVEGDYQSSFVLYDIDADSEDEALVFFTDTSVDSSIRMAVLDCIGGKWKLADDIKGSGSGIYDVDFADLDGDGRDELFVSWSLYDSKTTRIVSVYKTSGGSDKTITLKTLASEYYNSKYLTDFNGDGKTDMALVYLDDSTALQQSYLRLFSLGTDGTLVKYGELLLDNAVTSVARIQSDAVMLNTGTATRLFIDCMKTDVSMITEVVYWNDAKKKPVRVVQDPADTTLRSAKIFSRDIDGDGFLEVPLNSVLAGDPADLSINVSNEPVTFSLIEWFGAQEKGSAVSYTLYNPLHGYLFRFKWGNSVTVKYDKTNNALKFYVWNTAQKEKGDYLFSIYYRKNSETENVNSMLQEFYTTSTGKFYESISSAGASFGVTDTLIRQSFIKL